MKRILFNATHSEEIRLAVVEGQKLLDLDIESASYQLKKGNIYKAKITRVEPSLEAAFVDYGADRQGFLPLKEVSRIYFQNYDGRTPMGHVRIQDVLREGQELVVQVEKEERGNKGAALTTFISLAGRYLVLMPNNPRGGGISRRIEGEERAELREALGQLQLPEDYSVIARTAGIGRTAEELQWDCDYLIHLWEAISKAASEHRAPLLIYQESNLVVRTIRDYLRNDVNEILVDNPEIYERMQKFVEQVAPSFQGRLKLYRDESPLFSRFQIERQIESAYSREVRLESGGAIVFDKTEALVTIDVNSARATKGAGIEETAFNTNLEAAEEAARQLRLRDLGGLIVIDFIDMEHPRNQREVEQRLMEALKLDRARVQVGRISRFGLLEMSRQRLRPSLGEASSLTCPRCEGTGHIRGVASSALSVLRMVQEEAMKENSAAVHVHLPIETAAYLLNEKRREIAAIENRVGTPIMIIPTTKLETPQYRVRRLRLEEFDVEADTPSYEIEMRVDEEEAPRRHIGSASSQPQEAPKPIVVAMDPMSMPTRPVPVSATPESTDMPPEPKRAPQRPRSLLKRFLGALFQGDDEQPATQAAPGAAEDAPAAAAAAPSPAIRREAPRSREGDRNQGGSGAPGQRPQQRRDRDRNFGDRDRGRGRGAGHGQGQGRNQDPGQDQNRGQGQGQNRGRGRDQGEPRGENLRGAPRVDQDNDLNQNAGAATHAGDQENRPVTGGGEGQDRGGRRGRRGRRGGRQGQGRPGMEMRPSGTRGEFAEPANSDVSGELKDIEPGNRALPESSGEGEINYNLGGHETHPHAGRPMPEGGGEVRRGRRGRFRDRDATGASPAPEVHAQEPDSAGADAPRAEGFESAQTDVALQAPIPAPAPVPVPERPAERVAEKPADRPDVASASSWIRPEQESSSGLVQVETQRPRTEASQD